jgi:hypothetical protein
MSIAVECLAYLHHIPKSDIQLLAKQLTVQTGVSAFTHSIKMNNGLVVRPLVK